MNKKINILLLISSLFVTGCNINDVFNKDSSSNSSVKEELEFSILNGESATLKIGESLQLHACLGVEIINNVEWNSTDKSVATVSDSGYVLSLKEGKTTIVASYGEFTDYFFLTVKKDEIDEDIVSITTSKTEIEVGESLPVIISVNGESLEGGLIKILSGNEYATVENGNVLVGKQPGVVTICSGNSNVITITIVEKIITSDPYTNVTATEFYKNYKEASSYQDAYYRTLHGFMSGDIGEQDQEPTIAKNRPKEKGLYVKNSTMSYSNDGNTYYVYDSEGNIAKSIYKGAGYVTLEDVAAYVFAFGDIPANYVSNKKASPSSSVWGKYLRLNHSKFSGSTTKYPYEPELPDISGCGGSLTYYEIDIGTTGTDCDPSYDIVEYNNGSYITRGAARIVYSRFDVNNNKIIDINEKFVFYTYNHYNDFQEYLNYYGGWGEMFGNITGGGTLSSKYDYNPTSYVNIVLKAFKK